MSQEIIYEPVIGLEVHAQLSTRTKAFCSCEINVKSGPNDNVCEICSAQPGTLPVLNKKAVEFAVQAGLAIGAKINLKSVFSRKNYFYPDLPKGYQISQYDEPLCEGGTIKLEMKDGVKEVGVTRIHMEEDAGKSTHESGHSLVDLNRAGTPLIEIVSEPDMRTPEEAGAYLRKLHAIVTYLNICDGNMQEGNFRCDANVSIRPKGQKEFGIRAEVKNLNSFRFVEKAITYEIARQKDLLNNGKPMVQETRLFDSDKGVTQSMRSKEEAHDYRYFPEPDLITLKFEDSFVEEQRTKLPELPDAKKERFISEYELPEYDSSVITSSKELAFFFESVISGLSKKEPKSFKMTSNWIMTELMRILNEENLEAKDIPVTPENFSSLINLILDGTISGKIAKEIFPKMWETGDAPGKLVESMGLSQISDEGEIEKIIDAVIEASPKQLEQYRAGKDKLFGFFVGQVMKETKGKANPAVVNKLLKSKL
jgi:aspartyl-tRNA(Asn)/glutamyl-tRNA(Gln) amidotransferase subunit B